MDIGPAELLIVLAIVLLLFGSKKLPEMACGMGQAAKEFRKRDARRFERHHRDQRDEDPTTDSGPVPFDGAFSPIHWVIIGVVALMVLGPERLPDAARGLGRAMRAFEKAKYSVMQEISGALDPGPDDQGQAESGVGR